VPKPKVWPEPILQAHASANETSGHPGLHSAVVTP